MERLTRRINGVVVYVGAKNPYSTGQIPCEVEPAGVREMMDRLAAYEDTGLTPEEINDLASVREISPEAEYAINKHADNIIERLDKLLHQTDDDARLRELAEADKDGRLVVLPFTSGRTLLCKENIDSPRLMKDVELAIRYCSSCGIVFHMGYNLFCDLVKHGRITVVSEEAEAALEAKSND